MRTFISRVVHAAARGEHADLAGVSFGAAPDDSADWCDVRDCARGIALLATAPALRHATYNVGCGVSSRNRDVVRAALEAVADAELGLPQAFAEPPSDTRPGLALDIARLREDTGYAPRFTLTEGVADYVAWLCAGHAF